MKLDKIEKTILKDLKQGEPFSFRITNGKLYIGVRYNYDKNYDEFNIFITDINSTSTGLLKK